MSISARDFSRRVFSRPLNAEQLRREEEITQTLAGVGTVILRNTPTSREQSLAVTKLEEACYWACKAIQGEPVANGVDVLRDRKDLLEKLRGLKVGPAKKKELALTEREIALAGVFFGLRKSSNDENENEMP